jgi:hypothetical protein
VLTAAATLARFRTSGHRLSLDPCSAGTNAMAAVRSSGIVSFLKVACDRVFGRRAVKDREKFSAPASANPFWQKVSKSAGGVA